MSKRLLVYVSLSLLSLQNFELFADPVSPGNKEKRLKTEESVEDIDGEKAQELEPPLKTNSFIELRPTVTPETGEYHTENVMELGYKWSEKTKVSYVQYFNTNLYSPPEKKTIFRKWGFTWQDGFARIKFSNLWQSEDKNTTFSMQERFYLPVAPKNDTYPSRIDQGMITIFRSYFTLRHKYFSFLESDIAIAPSFFIFNQSGFDTDKKEIANPLYETVVNQSTDFKISNSVLFTLPFSFRMTRNRDYSEGAAQNDDWSYSLSALPEIDWSLNARHTLGASFVTDNFLIANGSGTDWKHALLHGVIQVLWNVKF